MKLTKFTIYKFISNKDHKIMFLKHLKDIINKLNHFRGTAILSSKKVNNIYKRWSLKKTILLRLSVKPIEKYL